MSSSHFQSGAPAAIAEIRAVVGSESVLTDAASREFYAQDVYRRGELPLAVVKPADATELSAVLRVIARHGLSVIPRGGGLSYTDGYLARDSKSITVDVRRMNRIVEVNPQDGYVTVECGATWKELHVAVSALRMRTPYWGPLSGLRSTVGGALSQGSVFFGSGRYGPAADSVIGLDVVLVDGTLLRLGGHALANGEPFFRHVGPDLLGMFLSDTGAMGIKTRATLRLIPRPTETRHLSFGYDTSDEVLAALAAVAREEIASECFALDSVLHGKLASPSTLTQSLSTVLRVGKGTGGLAGLKAAARLICAGRGFLKNINYSLHLSFDGRDAADVTARVARARFLLARNGREIAGSIPQALHATPFEEVTGMLGPEGERWVNVHGIVPFSQARAMFHRCEDVFSRHRTALERQGIVRGYLMCAVGTAGMLIEPVLYWPDALHIFHERTLPAEYLARLKRFPENPAARETVAQLRSELARAFRDRGATHFQLGKFYEFQQSLDPGAAGFLRALKRMVDPDGRMNPGSLGLGTGSH